MADKFVNELNAELKICKRESAAKIRQLTAKLYKLQNASDEIKQTVAEQNKELKDFRAKAKIPQIDGIRMIVVHPEVTCPNCHTKFKPK